MIEVKGDSDPADLFTITFKISRFYLALFIGNKNNDETEVYFKMEKIGKTLFLLFPLGLFTWNVSLIFQQMTKQKNVLVRRLVLEKYKH